MGCHCRTRQGLRQCCGNVAATRPGAGVEACNKHCGNVAAMSRQCFVLSKKTQKQCSGNAAAMLQQCSPKPATTKKTTLRQTKKTMLANRHPTSQKHHGHSHHPQHPHCKRRVLSLGCGGDFHVRGGRSPFPNPRSGGSAPVRRGRSHPPDLSSAGPRLSDLRSGGPRL